MLLVCAGALLVVAANPAQAQLSGIQLSVVPAFPSSVQVGGQNQQGAVAIINNSLGTISGVPVTVSNIRMNRSFATSAVGNPEPCPTPEPRPIPSSPIFNVDPIATGRAGTACAGILFAVSPPNANGTVTFTPSAPVVLGPSGVGGPASQCIVDFTFDVVQRPTDGQTFAVTVLDATAPDPAVPGQIVGPVPQTGGSSLIIVNRANPTIATVATPASADVGSPLRDTATISGGALKPTGTVTFQLFADPACATAIFTSTGEVDPTGVAPPAGSRPRRAARTTGSPPTAVTPTTARPVPPPVSIRPNRSW